MTRLPKKLIMLVAGLACCAIAAGNPRVRDDRQIKAYRHGDPDSIGGTGSQTSIPTVSVDHPGEDYHHGDPVVISGSGFQALDSLTVDVRDPDGAVEVTYPVTADITGGFTVNHTAGSGHGQHTIEVLDTGGTVLASTIFFVGSHFRFGTLSWAPVPGGAPGEVVFRFIGGFRRGYPGPQMVGDIITETIGGTNLNFGDGTAVTPTLRFRIIAFSAVDNWILGEALHPGTDNAGIRHTYAASGPYIAFSASAARIAALNNRSNGAYRLETRVTPRNGDSSPVTTQVPMVTVGVASPGAVCVAPVTFAVPGADPDGDTLRWRLSTDPEAGGGPSPPNLSVDPSTGIVSWCNAGLNQVNPWTVQIVVEALDPMGVVKSKTPVDFFLFIRPQVGTPPSCSIMPPGPFNVFAGSLMAFTVTATDADAGAIVTLNTGGLPTGATMAPSLPISGASPQSSTFNWTPSQLQGGAHVVLFSVSDNNGQQSQCSVTINVSTNRPPTCNAGGPYSAECGGATTSIVLDGSGSSDPDGNALSYAWSSDCPGASFMGGNTATPTLMLDSVAPCPLNCSVTLTVSDGIAPPVSCTAMVTVSDTTAPTIDCPPDVTVGTDPGQCTAAAAGVPLGMPTAADSCGSVGLMTDAPPVYPLGSTMVTWTATDDCGLQSTCTQEVVVEDREPPVLTCSVSPDMLWPPNHDLIGMQPDFGVSDNCDGAPSLSLTVYSDEDDETQTGDGNHSPDAKSDDPYELRLRAERKGDSDGRVYLVTRSATDAAGNTSLCGATVVVPHSQKRAAIAGVQAQAAAALAYYNANGVPPPGFVLVGDGPEIGPKQ